MSIVWGKSIPSTVVSDSATKKADSASDMLIIILYWYFVVARYNQSFFL